MQVWKDCQVLLETWEEKANLVFQPSDQQMEKMVSLDWMDVKEGLDLMATKVLQGSLDSQD